MMNLKLASSFALTAVALFVAGCATDIEPGEPTETSAEGETVVAPDEESYSADPQQAAGCTTSTSCDRNYCCTTTVCRFSTFVECVPARKVAK